MEGVALWSYVVLWVLVLVLAVLLIGTLRQVGQLWQRLGPETPLDRPTELAIGSRLDVEWLPAGDGARRVVLFVSPTCGVCERVLGGLHRLLGPHDRLVLVCQSSEEVCAPYLAHYGLVADPDGSRIEAARVADIPFAVLLDGDDMTERTAIVNSPKQVELMLRAAEASAA